MSVPPSPGGVPPTPQPPTNTLSGLALELAQDPTFVATVERHRPAAFAVEAAEALVPDLEARLRPACSHLTNADFAALVLDVARMKLRFAAIEERWVHRASGVTPSVDR